MNQIENCPVCGHQQQELFMNVKDHMITQEMFKIVSCKKCGFHFTNPIPEKKDIGAYYKSEEYVSHSSSNKGFVNALYNKVRKITLKQKIRWIKRETSSDQLLDIGCGTGHFLKEAKESGFHGTGLEPDKEARDFAKRENDVIAFPLDDLYTLKENSVGAITLWHVLEHVYDLKKDILEYRRILKRDGVLFIAVPNMGSYDAQFYKEDWAAYDVPRHLYHFQKGDIDKFFCCNGFTLQKVIPMKFDSFYVSMLSEKYKSGNLLKAFVIGCISNFKARKYGYSSQVYVLKRE